MNELINLSMEVVFSKQLMELKRTQESRNVYVKNLSRLKVFVDSELKKQTVSDLTDIESLFDMQNNPKYNRQ